MNPQNNEHAFDLFNFIVKLSLWNTQKGKQKNFSAKQEKK